MAKPTYYEMLRDPRWIARSRQVRQRAGHACEECGATDVRLSAHHRHYVTGRLLWDYQDHELRCLCDECHGYFHDTKQALDRYAGELDSNWLDRLRVIACRLASLQREDDRDPDSAVAQALGLLKEKINWGGDCGR